MLYIDDLDRCEPRRVVEVLQAVHLLLAMPLFVVVVAVDPRWLLRALKVHYPEMLLDPNPTSRAGALLTADEPEAERLHEEQPPVAASLASPRDYLEKIFQIPYTVPAMSPAASMDYVRDLLERTRPRPTKEVERQPTAETSVMRPASPSDEETRVSPHEPEVLPLRQRILAWLRDTGVLPTEALPPPIDEEQTDEEVEGQVVEENDVDDESRADEVAGVEADPRSLSLDEREHELIVKLGPIFRSPRSAKRFINVY